MKNVFIIGARGYHASYGGWETFVSKLVDYYSDKDTKFYITAYTSDKGDKELVINDNVIVFPIYVKNVGGATMFLHSVKALKFCINYVKSKFINSSN